MKKGTFGNTDTTTTKKFRSEDLKHLALSKETTYPLFVSFPRSHYSCFSENTWITHVSRPYFIVLRGFFLTCHNVLLCCCFLHFLHFRNILWLGHRFLTHFTPNVNETFYSSVKFFFSEAEGLFFGSIFSFQLGWVGERTLREVLADGCHKLRTAIEN